MTNWFEKVSQKVFLGSCVNCLENPEFHNIASDATELAQIVESGTEISKEQLLGMCQVDEKMMRLIYSGRCSFFVNGIAWAYDKLDDVHYFYG